MKRSDDLAPCGVYCGACPSYKKTCLGCPPENRDQPRRSKWGCKIRECCYHEEKKEFCIDCSRFPCKTYSKKLLSTHLGDPRFRYRHEIPGNFMKMKELGLKGYIEYLERRWTCPFCGGRVFLYYYKCSRCGREVTVL